jgi:siroheme synthase
VTFVRGHEDEGREKPRVHWESLARLDGTIVCYAGPKQLPKMLHALVEHGRPPDEPAALITNGTLSTQLTTSGTLGELIERLGYAGRGRLIVAVGHFRDTCAGSMCGRSSAAARS